MRPVGEQVEGHDELSDIFAIRRQDGDSIRKGIICPPVRLPRFLWILDAYLSPT